jgi:hypothetical protein
VWTALFLEGEEVVVSVKVRRWPLNLGGRAILWWFVKAGLDGAGLRSRKGSEDRMLLVLLGQ